MRLIFACMIAFATPSIIACLIDTEIVLFAAMFGFIGTVTFTIASLTDRRIQAGCLLRGITIASPLILALYASIKAGPEAKGMMLLMSLFLFAGVCSAATASTLIPTTAKPE